jgi:hypothetical protein
MRSAMRSDNSNHDRLIKNSSAGSKIGALQEVQRISYAVQFPQGTHATLRRGTVRILAGADLCRSM